MSETPALALSVAKAIFEQLSGFRGYPKPGLGKDRFVEVFQKAVISVDHARAVISSFDDQMPTLREIRDTALALRPKFEPPVNQFEQWGKIYGKPDSAWSRRMTETAIGNVATMDPKERKKQHVEERRAMLWQAIRDSIFYTETPMGRADLSQITDDEERFEAFKFWRQAAKRNQRDHPSEASAFRMELARDGWDNLMTYDWAKGTFPPVARPVESGGAVAVIENPITQADINSELKKAGREPGDEG